MLAGLGGTVAAAGAGLLLSSGLLPEPLSVGVLLLLVLAVPTSTRLAARITINIAMVVGWVPLLWWVDWPVRLNHGALIAAATVGGLVVYVLVSADPCARIRGLVPRVRAADLLLPVGAVASIAAVSPLLFATTPQRALSVLAPGADNWAHFAMFANLRAYGATTDALGPAPDGSGWGFTGYPKGFHALAATLSEVTAPRMVTGVGSLVVYAHAVGLIVVIGVVMVTAAILAIPQLDVRPAITVPVVATTWFGLIWEPGQKVLANGFASFWIASVAAATALLIAVVGPRWNVTVQVAAVTGLLVFVCHAWTPLAIIGAPALLIVLVRSDALRPGSDRTRWLGPVVVLGLGAVAALKAVLVLVSTVPVHYVVSSVSGFDGTSPRPTFVCLAMFLIAHLRYRTWVRAGTGADVPLAEVLRLRLLGLAPLLGFLSLTALLMLQIRTIGTTSYYFLKYLIGFELVLTCVTPAFCGVVLSQVTRPGGRRRTVALSIVAVLLGSQLYVPGFRAGALLLSDTDDGTAAVRPPYSRPLLARGVLVAVASTTPAASLEREYLPLGPGNAIQTFYPDAWFHAITASVTDTVWSRMAVLRVKADTPSDAAPLVERLLSEDPSVRVMVAPPYVDELRAVLPTQLRVRLVALRGATTRPPLNPLAHR